MRVYREKDRMRTISAAIKISLKARIHNQKLRKARKAKSYDYKASCFDLSKEPTNYVVLKKKAVKSKVVEQKKILKRVKNNFCT